MITNIDRELWLIDHGASLYFHHNWSGWKAHLSRTFPAIKDHVLLKRADQLNEASKAIKDLISEDSIKEIVSWIPEDWLLEEGDSLSPDEKKAAYIEFLSSRLNKIDLLAKEASDAR